MTETTVDVNEVLWTLGSQQITMTFLEVVAAGQEVRASLSIPLSVSVSLSVSLTLFLSLSFYLFISLSLLLSPHLSPPLFLCPRLSLSLSVVSFLSAWLSLFVCPPPLLRLKMNVSPHEQVVVFIPAPACRGQPLCISLPWDGTNADLLGVALPELGVRENQESITIAIDAIAGPIRATPFKSVTPVGAFTGPVTVAFPFPAVASLPADISLHLTPEMDLVANDALTLTLPGFTGAPFADRGGGGGLVRSMSWNETAGELTFVVAQTVLANTSVRIFVSRGALSHPPLPSQKTDRVLASTLYPPLPTPPTPKPKN